MTYLSFLLLFLGLPLAALSLVLLVARRLWLTRLGLLAVAVHILLALVYTTPWDNYLVATGVWTYAPARVLGATLGWVPLEEYGFFVLQTLLTGLCSALLLTHGPSSPSQWARQAPHAWLKPAVLLGLAGLWLLAVLALVAAWKPGTYLALELVWALPPIALQWTTGAETLWPRRGTMLAVWLPLTFYLCAADTLAIQAGVWHIAEAQSLNLLLAGLPIEEAVFFVLTNLLVIFGVTLVLAPPKRLRRLAGQNLRARVNKTLRVWLARS